RAPSGAFRPRGTASGRGSDDPQRLQSLPLGRADLLDARVGPLLQVGVTRVAGVLVWVVAGGVVAADQRPARLIAGVAVRAVLEVAVEEEGVARPELAVDALESLEGGAEALGVCTRLVADRAVIDPAHAVRALQHLQASVGAGRAIDGDQATGEVGEQATI